MSDSRIPAAVDKLVEIFGAATAADVKIIDGPFVTGAEPTKRVYVGYDGDPEGEWSGATADQSWAGTLGAQRRNEEFSVPCCVVVHNGAGNAKAARDGAFAVFADVSDALRANNSLDFPSPSTVEMSSAALTWALNEDTGLEAHIPFNVNVSTRI